jgi:transcriptional regulator with XRE-family HTH domain
MTVPCPDSGTIRQDRCMGEAWGRLGDAIVARRVRMGIKTREQFAERSGLSLRTLHDLERGNRSSYDPSTLARLERALDWTEGSAQRVLAGGSPTPTDEVPSVFAPEGMDPIAAELVYVLSPDSPVDEDEKETLRMVLDQLLRRARMQIRSAQRQAGGD